MRYLILLVFLVGCTTSYPQSEKIEQMHIPMQYAVNKTTESSALLYIVKDEEFIACQGTIDGRKCTKEDLEEHGMTMTDMKKEMMTWESPSLEGNCILQESKRACFDDAGAIVSYADGAAFSIQYVR